jgi:hypothetical protein
MRSIRGRFAKPRELTAGNARARIPVAGKKALGRSLYYESLLVEQKAKKSRQVFATGMGVAMYVRMSALILGGVQNITYSTEPEVPVWPVAVTSERVCSKEEFSSIGALTRIASGTIGFMAETALSVS